MTELDPKPPELLQKLEWLRLHGRSHWKHILVFLMIIIVPFIWKLNSDRSPESRVSEGAHIPGALEPGSEENHNPAPVVHFSDGAIATVEMAVQVQLDPELLLEAHSLFGSADAAQKSLLTTIRGAAISVLETKTMEYTRLHRAELSAEIVGLTVEAQEKTAYMISELSIMGINEE